MEQCLFRSDQKYLYWLWRTLHLLILVIFCKCFWFLTAIFLCLWPILQNSYSFSPSPNPQSESSCTVTSFVPIYFSLPCLTYFIIVSNLFLKFIFSSKLASCCVELFGKMLLFLGFELTLSSLDNFQISFCQEFTVVHMREPNGISEIALDKSEILKLQLPCKW